MMWKSLTILALMTMIAGGARASITNLPAVGPSGPTGPSGPAGPTGATGAQGISTFGCTHAGTPTFHGALGASNCGTGASIVGTDCQGTITLGGDYTGGCIIDFAQSFSTTPACAVTEHAPSTVGLVIGALPPIGSVGQVIVGPALVGVPTDANPTTTQVTLDTNDQGAPGGPLGYLCNNKALLQ